MKKLMATAAMGLVIGMTGMAAAQSDVQQKPGAQQMQKTTPGSSGTEAGSASTQPGTKMENRAAGQSPSTSGQAPVGTTEPATGGMKKADEQKK